MSDHDARYGVPVDDPDATLISDVLVKLSQDQRDEILRCLAAAIVGSRNAGSAEPLQLLARDVTATARVQHDPAYQRAVAAAPSRPTGPGRSVKEVFAAMRANPSA